MLAHYKPGLVLLVQSDCGPGQQLLLLRQLLLDPVTLSQQGQLLLFPLKFLGQVDTVKMHGIELHL